MKKTILAVILLMGCYGNSFAQNESGTPEPPGTKKNKDVEQFVGVQINGLIKQVLNFNNTNSTTALNPYLLNYSISSKRTGWGLRLGLGYTYSSTYNNDGISETTTKINDLHCRLGIEKAFKLSDKWSAGVGLDLVSDMNNDNTKNTVSSGDTVTTETKDIISNLGGGAMGWLRYHLTERILIGTEASYYFVSGTDKRTIDVTQTVNFGSGSSKSTTETSTKPTITTAGFSSPVVFYLIVKF